MPISTPSPNFAEAPITLKERGMVVSPSRVKEAIEIIKCINSRTNKVANTYQEASRNEISIVLNY